MIEGFNIVYAKKGGSPKNIYFEKRMEVTEFLLSNLNSIDFMSINEVIIDKDTLVKNHLKLARYLKLKKIYEI